MENQLSEPINDGTQKDDTTAMLSGDEITEPSSDNSTTGFVPSTSQTESREISIPNDANVLESTENRHQDAKLRDWELEESAGTHDRTFESVGAVSSGHPSSSQVSHEAKSSILNDATCDVQTSTDAGGLTKRQVFDLKYEVDENRETMIELKLEAHANCDRVHILELKIEEFKEKILFLDELGLANYQISPEDEKYLKNAAEEILPLKKEATENRDGVNLLQEILLEKLNATNLNQMPHATKRILGEMKKKIKPLKKEAKKIDKILQDIEEKIFSLDEIDPTNLYQMSRDDEKISMDERTRNPCRGIFLVLCHMVFRHRNISRLNGTFQACKNLKETWSRFGFKFVIKWNATEKNVRKIITKFAEEFDHTSYKCFACAVMTHGQEEDKLCAFDSSRENLYPIEVIYKPFEECKSLSGKPKLFFMDACRGRKFDSGMAAVAHVVEPMPKMTLRVPKNADFLLAFATTEGFVAFVHKNSGSHFIHALNECVKDYSSLDLLTILTEAIAKLAAEDIPFRNRNDNKQCPTILSRLRIPFYLELCAKATENQTPWKRSSYPNQGLPGIFLILIQTRRDKSVPGGLEKDECKLKQDLTNLGFEVRSEHFVDEGNIINILQPYTNIRSRVSYENRRCFACIVLSTGVDGYEIFAEKSSYHYKQMIQPFIDCQAWVGKPKLFFIQANVNEAMRALSKERGPYPRKVMLSPEEADVLIMFSPDNPTEETTGSLFVNSLTSCIWRNRHDRDLLTILTQVVGEVARVVTVSGREYNLCPTIVSRLTKQFYFEDE